MCACVWVRVCVDARACGFVGLCTAGHALVGVHKNLQMAQACRDNVLTASGLLKASL